MAKSLILFLSSLLIFLYGCGQVVIKTRALDCNNRHIQDSLVEKYITNGAEQLLYMYNNPAWPLACDSIIAICPNVAAAYQLKAVPFIKNGDYEKAFALNDKAVELYPERYTSYRGFLKCIFTKDYEGAILDFKKAQELTPYGGEMDHSFFFYEGLCNLELRNYSLAEENFKQDMLQQTHGDKKITPHFNTLLYTGILYYEMNNALKAKEYLQRCLVTYQQLPEANYYLALQYEKEGNIPLMKKHLEIAKQSIIDKYSMNEDNLYYANYPHQIKMYEIELKLNDIAN